MTVELIKKDATLQDTITLIIDSVNDYKNSKFIVDLVSKLNPEGDKYLFMHRLFNYIVNNADYKLDPEGKEIVSSPERTMQMQKYDCKKISVLIAAVLKHVGIEPVLKHVFYSTGDITHIYVIVPYPDLNTYVIIDPVNGEQFDKEVSYSQSTLFDLNGKIITMDLYKISGNKTAGTSSRKTTFLDSVSTGCGEMQGDMAAIMGVPELTVGERLAIFEEAVPGITKANLSDIIKAPWATQRAPGGGGSSGNFERVIDLYSPPADPYGAAPGTFRMSGKFWDKVKEKAKAIVNKVATVGLSVPRGAFLLALKGNLFKFASKLAAAWKKDKAAVTTFWEKFGGDINSLKQAIAQGSKQTISGVNINTRSRAYLLSHVTTGQSVAAVMAAALPVASAALIMLKKLGIIGDDDEAEDGLEGSLDNLPSDFDPTNAGTPNDNSGRDQDGRLSSGSFAFALTTKAGIINALVKSPIIIAAIAMSTANEIIFFSLVFSILSIYTYRTQLKNFIKKISL